jgi:chaperonin GroES
MSDIKLRPLEDRILVEPIEQDEKTSGGILLPETAKEKPQQGKVLAVGPGKRDDKGKIIPVDVNVRDTVLFAKYAGTEVKVDGNKQQIIRVSDILAVVNPN